MKTWKKLAKIFGVKPIFKTIKFANDDVPRFLEKLEKAEKEARKYPIKIDA